MIPKELLQNEYKSWLQQNVKTESSRNKYFSAIQIISKEMLALKVIDKDLFEVVNFEDFIILCDKILKNNFFIKKDRVGHNMYSSALRNYYRNFLAEKFYCDNDIVLDMNTSTWTDETDKGEYRAEISLSTLSKLQELKSGNITEGEKRKIQSYVYERNSRARLLCIEHYGSVCQVCGCDMAKIYGEEFTGKIHVHHKVPLNEIAQSYEVDPIKDLVPVCPNCHMILHCKKDGYYTVDEIREKINKLR